MKIKKTFTVKFIEEQLKNKKHIKPDSYYKIFEIYFTLLFELLQWCVFAGIYPIEEEKDNEGRNFLSKLIFEIDYCDHYNNFPC